MHGTRTVIAVVSLVLAPLTSTRLDAQSAAQNAADAAWLTQVLEVKDGATVGEIGAGGGELTLLLAKAVGPAGRILSNDSIPIA